MRHNEEYVYVRSRLVSILHDMSSIISDTKIQSKLWHEENYTSHTSCTKSFWKKYLLYIHCSMRSRRPSACSLNQQHTQRTTNKTKQNYTNKQPHFISKHA